MPPLIRIALTLLIGGATLAMMPPADAAGGTSTTQFVTMTFAEPTHPALDCPGFPDVSCGSGEVIPLGQATETLVFGAGCGGTCDLRTITLAGGSLTIEETVTNAVCPHVCRPGPLELGRTATVTDVVIGGTGIFEGATGTLTGTVRAAVSNVRPAGSATVKLSGTPSYALA
jgi:hypothetical protein